MCSGNFSSLWSYLAGVFWQFQFSAVLLPSYIAGVSGQPQLSVALPSRCFMATSVLTGPIKQVFHGNSILTGLT